MDNLIRKRSATERLIIAETLIETVLEDMPSAQPEIIRCRDCKFCKKYYHGPEINLDMFTYECIRRLDTVTADGFCSEAERKTEQTERSSE